MRTAAHVGQPTVKVEGEKQSVRLDVARDVNRFAVTVVEIDCGEVDPVGSHCMADAAWKGGNLGGDAAFNFG